jgi:phosphoribosylanthranilate isomerase
MFIKVCGIKTFEHIDWAMSLGYTAVGVVLYKKSKRYVDDDTAKKLAQYARGKIKSVAVSVSYADVSNVEDSFDYIQVYEQINKNNLIFASNAKPLDNNFKYFLYDNSKGSGEFESFPEWLEMLRSKLIIAGGLNYKNVKNVIKQYQPFGVDVSSGVENAQGEKDYELMKKFIESVKGGE